MNTKLSMIIESTPHRVKIEDDLYQRAGYILIRIIHNGKPTFEPTGLQYTKRGLSAARTLLEKIREAVHFNRFTFSEYLPRSKKAQEEGAGVSTDFAHFVNAWFKHWKKENALGSPHTVRSYEASIKNHILPGLGDRIVKDMTAVDIERFMSSLKNTKTGKPLGHSKRQDVSTVLKSIFDFAFAFDRMGSKANPFLSYVGFEKSKGKKKTEANKKQSKETVDPFTESERARLLSDGVFMFEQERNMCGFAMAMGLRLGEVFGISWDKVDLSKRTLRVEQQISEGLFKEPKAGSKRILYINDDAMHYLMAQRRFKFQSKVIPEMEFLLDKEVSGSRAIIKKQLKFVFFNPHSGEPYMRSDNFSPRWYKALEVAGIHTGTQRRRSPNQMRHTCASRMRTNGFEMAEIAAQLGNTLKVCEARYAKIIAKDVKFDAERFNRLMGVTHEQ